MAVPARKKSKTKSRTRRNSNMKYGVIQYNTCKNCGNVKIPYCVCRFCGYYKLQKVLQIKSKSPKKHN